MASEGAMSRSYFLRYFALGFGSCLAMLAVAAVAAFTVMQTDGDALEAGPGNATPTPLQMKQALEYMAGHRPVQTSPAQSGGSSAGDGGAGAQATVTPGTPEARLSGSSTPPAPSSGANNVTPQPTTTSNSAAVPTRTPFTPPTIVPIQPLVTTPSSPAIQPAASTPPSPAPVQPASTPQTSR